MKKQARRVSSFVLVLMIVFSCFANVLSVEAAEINQTASGTGTVQIGGSTITLDFPPGSFFTDNGKACTDHSTSGIHSSTNESACNCRCTYNGTALGACQCFGYARYIQTVLFGKNSYTNSGSFYKVSGASVSAGSLTASKLKSIIYSSGNVKPGAHLRTNASQHSMIITQITADGFSIIQANGSNNDEYSGYSACRVGTHTYSWSSYVNSTYGSRGINYIEMPYDYNIPDSTERYVDLGTDFYAYIINTSCWKHLTNDYDNVCFRTETGQANQVWRFECQSDGSYKIINCGNNKVLDVETAGSESGLNVHVWESTGNDNQKWYIYGESGAFVLKPKCSDCVLDMNSGEFSEGVNAQIWTRNDTAAQKFQIYGLNAPSASYLHVAAGTNYTPTSLWWIATDNTTKYDLRIYKGKVWEGEPYKTVFGTTETSVSIDLPSGYYEASIASVNNFTYTLGQNTVGFTVSDGEIVDIGDDVYANIIRNDDWQALADIDGNVCINNDKNNIWHFRKLDDGGYTIQNTSTGGYLDLNNFTDENCANIQTWEYNGTSAQIWYIYGRWSGEYYFKPKCTSSRVLDVDRDSGNAQVYDLLWNNNQKMAIWGLNKPEAANLSYSVGNKYKPTRIWWNQTNDTNNYTLRIYKDKIWEGKEIGSVWNTTNTMCSVNLPAGYYEAYVDSNNDYSYTMSNNIIKFTVTEGTPETIDTNFYAYIINTNTEAYLINDKNGNACFNKPANVDNLQKIWYFTRNDNDSFTITSVLDNNVLDVYDNQDENGANVQLWVSKNGANQQWYIQGESPYYQIKPAFTDRALDLNGGKYYDNVNAQIWEKNETDAQKYKIVVVEKPVVSYNMNGGSGTIKAQTKEFGKDLTLSSTKPTRTGYTFLGWSTDKNATTAQYQPGGKYTANASATLYAIWKINTYTVSYDMNGGTGTIANQTKTYGKDLTLSSTKPTRTGYVFLGWSTDKNATTAQYQSGGKYTANSSATLYAIWKEYEYELSGWTWNGTTSAIANFTCKDDSSQNKTVNATITSETTAATCEKAGKTVYTATATFEGKPYTDTKEVPISAIGHKYVLTSWNWNGEIASAIFTCENDKTHTTTVTANVTSKTEGDTVIRTAAVVLDGQPYTDTKTEIITPAQTDSDSDTSSDKHSDSDYKTSDTDTEKSTDSENASDTEMSTDTQTDSDNTVDTESNTETHSDVVIESDSDKNSDTETGTDTSTDDGSTDSEPPVSHDSDTENTDVSTDIKPTDSTDTETETDTSSESDTVSDTDTLTDTNSDTNINSDVDTSDSDSNVPNDSETDTASDVDTSSDITSDTDTNSDIDTSSDKGSDTESKTDTDIQTDSDTDTSKEVDTETDSDNKPDDQTDTDKHSDTDDQTDTDTPDIPDDKAKGTYGDLDGDGDITANDALMILRASVGMETLTPEQIALADVDGDGDITANDALAVLRYSVGMGDGGNVGKEIA